MKKLCLIGNPIGHSLSPLLHGIMLAQTGAPYTYELHPLPAEKLADFVAEARGGVWAGFNVTMPYKAAIVPLLDEVDPFAASCGAVNTVCVRDGRAIGYNTDGSGFVDSLRFRGIDPLGREVLLLGAGGAASAVCLALAQAGAAHIRIAARRAERARALCALCDGRGEAIGFDTDGLCRAAAVSTLLVNATSLGMSGMDEFQSLDFLRTLPAEAAVYDLVYQPRRTTLLTAAEERGFAAVPGTALLTHQAVRAFTLFTGETAEVPALPDMPEGSVQLC